MNRTQVHSQHATNNNVCKYKDCPLKYHKKSTSADTPKSSKKNEFIAKYEPDKHVSSSKSGSKNTKAVLQIESIDSEEIKKEYGLLDRSPKVDNTKVEHKNPACGEENHKHDDNCELDYEDECKKLASKS